MFVDSEREDTREEFDPGVSQLFRCVIQIAEGVQSAGLGVVCGSVSLSARRCIWFIGLTHTGWSVIEDMVLASVVVRAA